LGLASVLGSEVIFAKNIPKVMSILGKKALADLLPEGKCQI